RGAVLFEFGMLRAEVEMVLEANNIFHIRPDPLAASRRSVEWLFRDPYLVQVFAAHQRKRLLSTDARKTFRPPSLQDAHPPPAPSSSSLGSAGSQTERESQSPRKLRQKLPSLEEVFQAFWESTGRDADAAQGEATGGAGERGRARERGEKGEEGLRGGSGGWDEWTARGRLLDAACPSLYGMGSAKLALLLTLISGCEARTVPPGGFGDTRALAANSFASQEEGDQQEEESGSRWRKFVRPAAGDAQREADIWAPPTNRAAYLLWGGDAADGDDVKAETSRSKAKREKATGEQGEGEGGRRGERDSRLHRQPDERVASEEDEGARCQDCRRPGRDDREDGDVEGVRHRDAKRKREDRESGEGCSTRHKCHLLLLGATGTGKSTLLLAGRRLAQKAFGATGMGCTAAGLTCAAVRDSGNGAWHLDPGILVLADEGVCCLDDLYLMKKDAQAAIHEAMEQQSISVAKAGLVTRLTARCSIIAATSTETGAVGGKTFSSLSRLFDANSPSSSSECYADLPCLDANMPPPLFSRFDAVVVLGDAPRAIDAVTDFIVGRAVGRGQKSSAAGPLPPPLDVATHASKTEIGSSSSLECSRAAQGRRRPSALGALLSWTTSLLRLYLAFVGNTFFPGLSRQAGQVLSRYYLRLRAVGSSSGESRSAGGALQALGPFGKPAGPHGGGTGVTVRFFEGLFRLTQAHARLMARHTATRRDAIAVIWMLETSLCGNRVVPGLKKGNADVPEGRHGLLRLSEASTARVVDFLCVLPPQKNSGAYSAGPDEWSRCPGGAENAGNRESTGQLVYPSLQTVAGKALHCDIRSEAQYLAVEKLILKNLGLSMESGGAQQT
ncbi:MCM2/3/5 family protein, partial [Toxoplasma gondii FOU]